MCEVVWYGERGIINALVTDLASRGLDPTLQFLRTIRWADDGQPAWINEVKRVTFVVEIHLAEFGVPDLMLVCRSGTSEINVVFVEAKAGPYLESAMPNDPGMLVEGFNSSINGQLSLRYRCACALQQWNGETSVLIEPRALLHLYRRPSRAWGLHDRAKKPRRLEQATVLRILRENEVHNLPADRYHFVAWTWDTTPFWDQPEVEAADMVPRFLAEPAGEMWEEEGDIWNRMTHRVGCILDQDIEENVRPVDAYRRARETMIRAAWPPAETATAAFDPIRPINRDRFQEPTRHLLAELEAAARARFGQETVAPLRGSSSVTRAGRVIVKLLPRNPGPGEYVLLGLSAYLHPQEWLTIALEGPFLIGGQPFLVHQLPSPAHEQEAVAVAQTIFEQLAEQLRPHEA
jgi:hypothetical protein